MEFSAPAFYFPTPLKFTLTERCFGSLLVISIVPCAVPLTPGAN